MKTLISMVEFVLQESNNKNLEKHLLNKNGHDFMNIWNAIFSYAEFLKQPLYIWQFVPCKLIDGVWVVLDKPDLSNYHIDEEGSRFYNERLKEYQEAKSRCIFDGFEITYTDVFVKTISKGREINCFKINFKSKNVFINRDRIVVDTIEDLVKYNIELTASAIKELGL